MRLALLKKPLPGLGHKLAHSLGAAVDHSPYSHSNLVFTNGQSGSSWSGQGVRIRSVGYEAASWDFFALPERMNRTARAWFDKMQLRQPGYDHLGVLRFGLALLHESPTRYFCHEAIAEALGFSEPWRCGPGVLLSRCIDHLGAFKVDSPWTEPLDVRAHPAIIEAAERLAPVADHRSAA